MKMTTFENAYNNDDYAAAYARLEYPGTYYLAFRDLPDIFRAHVAGNRALDFGCGAGRSTRFLKTCGFEPVGIDISAAMVRKARELDPDGDYRLVEPGDFSSLEAGSYDLVFCAFPFDNIPGGEKLSLFSGLRKVLKPGGKLVLLGSTPEIYLHEWASFSTSAFPENRTAEEGGIVKCVNTDTRDFRPVDDILCSDSSYRAYFEGSGLEILETHRPLGRADEPYPWVSETAVAPWVIYVVRQRHPAQ